MKLKCLGSSSSGNGYILEGKSESLLLEAGMPISQVRRTCDRFSNIVGCLVTHRHGDHSKYIGDYLKAGIRVFSNSDVASKQDQRFGEIQELKPMDEFEVGGFVVLAFPALHDVPCLSYLIYHEELGTLLFVTDSDGIGFGFNNVDHVMIECNWSEPFMQKAIDEGRTKSFVAERSRETHMSLDRCISELTDVNEGRLSKTAKEVILLHLSHENADPNTFIQEVGNKVNKPVYVAKQGLELELTNGNDTDN